MKIEFKLGIILLAAIGLTSCLSPVKFEGSSMRPAINDGDRILVSTNVAEIKRGDIIQFRYPKDPERFYMKRVIGLPGENLEIRGGVTLINGNPISEEYIDPIYDQSGSVLSVRSIPEDHYFVMGDNRDNSSDSRIWGTVDHKLILGTFYWKYYSAESK